MQLVPMYAGKVKNQKDLYEFRVVLGKKVNEYEEEIGKEPDHNKLKDILFASMDVKSKQLISRAGLDKVKFIGEEGNKVEVDTYKTFVDDIDRRYRVEFATLEIKTKKDSDDPMGLHAVAEGEQKKEEYENKNGQAGAQDAPLDAVGKGKGKRKG